MGLNSSIVYGGLSSTDLRYENFGVQNLKVGEITNKLGAPYLYNPSAEYNWIEEFDKEILGAELPWEDLGSTTIAGPIDSIGGQYSTTTIGADVESVIIKKIANCGFRSDAPMWVSISALLTPGASGLFFGVGETIPSPFFTSGAAGLNTGGNYAGFYKLDPDTSWSFIVGDQTVEQTSRLDIAPFTEQRRYVFEWTYTPSPDGTFGNFVLYVDGFRVSSFSHQITTGVGGGLMKPIFVNHSGTNFLTVVQIDYFSVAQKKRS